MNKSRSSLLLLFLISLLMSSLQLFAAPEAEIPPTRPLPAAVYLISVDEAEALIQANKEIKIIDVRAKEEIIEQGQIERSQHLDGLRGDFADHFKSIAGVESKTILIYCALGGRSQRAAELAARLGYKDVRLLKGGYNAWKKAGKPIIKH